MAYYNENNVIDQNGKKIKSHNGGTMRLARVFGYMGIGLLITGLVAFGLAYLFFKLYPDKIAMNAIPGPLLAIFIVAAIALIIMSIVLSFVFLKGKHSLILPAIIYCVLFGCVLAPVSLLVDWRLIGMAFGITAVVFLLMTLLATLLGDRVGALAFVVMGLLMGAGIMCLMSFLFCLWMPGVAANLIWITNFVIFAIIMLVTIIDIARIKTIMDNGETNTNLELYCALTMYTDFLAIFIRILYYLIIIYGRN